jgi:lysophospholipase L1-like esterase
VQAQQPALVDSLKYPFLNLSANRIHIQDSVPGKFLSLYDKMNQLRNDDTGKVHFLQLGDSHIQADYMSSRVRYRLADLLGCKEAGRGLIFPYRLAQTNNPENYRVKSKAVWTADRSVNRNSAGDAGLAGVTVYTSDSALNLSLRLLPHISPVIPFTHLSLLSRDTGSCWSVETDLGLEGRLVSANGKTVLQKYSSEIPLDSVFVRIRKTCTSAPPFYLDGLLLTNNHPGYIYSALGSNGASSESLLRCGMLMSQLRMVQPDVLILSLGTNDAYNRPFIPERIVQQFDSILYTLSIEFPELPVVLTIPGDAWFRDHKDNKNIPVLRSELLKLAGKYQCASWDLYTIMGGANSISKWYAAGLARKDRLHFSKEGYYLLGDLFAEAWFEFFTTPATQLCMEY